MKLMTAHRILISSAVLLFFGYAARELLDYSNTGDGGALLRGALSAAASLGLGIYLRSVWRR